MFYLLLHYLFVCFVYSDTTGFIFCLLGNYLLVCFTCTFNLSNTLYNTFYFLGYYPLVRLTYTTTWLLPFGTFNILGNYSLLRFRYSTTPTPPPPPPPSLLLPHALRTLKSPFCTFYILSDRLSVLGNYPSPIANRIFQASSHGLMSDAQKAKWFGTSDL